MTRRLSGRVAKLEGKGGKDHFRFAEDEAEAEAIREWWRANPLSRLPGHRLYIVFSTMPKKDPNL